MPRLPLLILFLATIIATDGFVYADQPTHPRPRVDGFHLPGVTGQTIEVLPNEDAQLTVVCFLGTECPLAKLYGPRLNALANEFVERGVRFVGVNSNRQDSMDDLREYIERHEIEFPIAKDYGNVIADRFGAKRTPEVFVLDAEFSVCYRGRIDDQYSPGISRPQAHRHELRTAVDELLVGNPVTCPVTEPAGCLIGRVKHSQRDSDVTFCDQIARVLQTHCAECHRTGEIGPFSVQDYEEVVGWADMILEVVRDGRMPPWHASHEFGTYANERFMPAGDKELLREWVASGVPYGRPNRLPEPLEFVDGWQLPQGPDLVLQMRDQPYVVPSEGTVEYQYFVVNPGFEEDKWVTAAQVIPGNRAVVHHSIVFIRPPDGARFRGVGWLTAYVPGQRIAPPAAGRARFVPAGSKFVFQQHYTPIGRQQHDLTKVGLVFGEDEYITHELYTLVGIDQEFEIPPHAENFLVESRVRRIPESAQLLAIMPHMHVRGKSFRLFARRGEQRETLLHVPRYDFNWQHSYQLSTPLPLADIDDLEFTVTFDNSSNNPVNPDPSQLVMWGDQTWEEMAVAFFEVAEPRKQPTTATESSTNGDQDRSDESKRIDDFVNHFVQRFDANQDGEVAATETPRSLRRFGFHRMDHNGDGRLTRAEIRREARRRAE